VYFKILYAGIPQCLAQKQWCCSTAACDNTIDKTLKALVQSCPQSGSDMQSDVHAGKEQHEFRGLQGFKFTLNEESSPPLQFHHIPSWDDLADPYSLLQVAACLAGAVTAAAATGS
jgi:hypothetical protein